MNKFYLLLFLTVTLFCSKSFAQLPPQLITYSDSISEYFLTFNFSYTPNDTGATKAQIQLAQGSGNITYDSIFSLPAGASNASLVLGPLYRCANYSGLYLLLSNRLAYGSSNNLFSFNTLCTVSDIHEATDNSFFITVQDKAVQIHAAGLPLGASAEIFDLMGRKIRAVQLTEPLQQIMLNAGTGVYLLRLNNGHQTLYSSKFVLN